MTEQTMLNDILLVDDTPDNLRLLSTLLKEQGYKVRSVTSGAMALTVIQNAPPALIFLDINMPGMSGYQVAEKLKADPATAEIPIIFISALNETIDKVKAFSIGAVDYITKPFQFEEVLARLKTHLTLRQLQEQMASQNEILEQRVAERTQELQELTSAYEKFVPREFLTYLHKKSIAELMLGNQVQREMTILFADIQGFTSISEEMEPQQNMDFINAYLSLVSPIIREHHGFIDKFLGDGIMALFPEKAEDAVNAAIAIQNTLHEFNHHSPYPEIHSGVGIHTGSVMVGIIGESERMQTTVISDAVNLTARIESLTRHYDAHILISTNAMMALTDTMAFQMRCVDNVRVKGHREPVLVYEVFDSDENAALKAQTKAMFEQGLELYNQKKFAEASVQFSQVLQANPKDQAAKIYLERTARYMVEGVPQDWQGVESIF